MSSKIINKILSGLFLTDYAYSLYVLIITIYVWSPITQLYTGTYLYLFICKISIHIILGLSVILSLFLNRTKAIYIFLPLYIFEMFISKYWKLSPNSQYFQNLVVTTQQAVKSGKVLFDTKATINVYPYSFVYVFYVISLIYIYYVMPRWKTIK